ncbi:hypothetical protein Csa_013239 [Cucumis sativus]|nr:hypothetical protein Csa_013239 [Cucumis sativus]
MVGSSRKWAYIRIITGTVVGGVLGFYVMHRVEVGYKEKMKERLKQYENELKKKEQMKELEDSLYNQKQDLSVPNKIENQYTLFLPLETGRHPPLLFPHSAATVVNCVSLNLPTNSRLRENDISGLVWDTLSDAAVSRMSGRCRKPIS